MLPLHTHGKILGSFPSYPVKILGLSEALTTPLPRERVAVQLDDVTPVDHGSLSKLGFAAVQVAKLDGETSALPVLHSLAMPAVVASGDVIQVRPESGHVAVLYRRSSTANSLFITERCNSYCLMCSQPPRNVNDDWRIGQLRELVELIDPFVPTIGVTGGEPTLAGDHFTDLLRHARSNLPDTHLHVLTNGRLLSTGTFVDKFDGLQGHVTWAIPLYADLAEVHDHIVQARGAFYDTLEGIYNLQQRGHAIEVRYVLNKLTAPRIESFADFAIRNLPFVSNVAFMGLEPMGFAKVNREPLWIDPVDYAPALTDTVLRLDWCGLPVSIFNLPLCVLPRSVWRFMHKSISDWKRVYDPICANCAVRSRCGGFFRSAGDSWKSSALAPIVDGGTTA
jgi:His-Xaa-Ser system radical SAM maturase HxsC